jgi:hypothetical protein
MAAAVILSCAVMAAEAASRADFLNAAPEDNMSAVQFTGGAAGSTTHFPPLSTLQPASTVHSAKGTTAQGMVMAGFASVAAAAASACGASAPFLCAFSTGIALMQATHPASKRAQASSALMENRAELTRLFVPARNTASRMRPTLVAHVGSVFASTLFPPNMTLRHVEEDEGAARDLKYMKILRGSLLSYKFSSIHTKFHFCEI